MASLPELVRRRDEACRLTPGRALETLDDAAGWIHERGLVTLTPSAGLPSLFEACQEEPYDPSKAGFAQWPKTKWWWPLALEERDDVLATKLHRGKTMLLSHEAAQALDGICREELARTEAEPEWRRLLRHLADAGPSQLEDLQTELELRPREMKGLRGPLERVGAVVGKQLNVGGERVTELARWDQRVEPSGRPASLDDAVVAGVRAAVAVHEREPRRWFSWTWRWDRGLLDRLVADGRLARAEEHLWAP
jgi:hypothetical protein